jgi:Glycosyl transferases group 1
MQYLPLFSELEDQRFHTGGAARRLRIVLHARRRLKRRLMNNGDWDVTMVQRQVDLLPSLKLERLAASGKRLILDIDDAIWLDRSRDAGGHGLAALKGTPRKVRWLAAEADAVFAGNEILAEWLSHHSGRVVVVPSLVEHRDIPVRLHEQRERVLLGWIGSPPTSRSLRRLLDPLRRLSTVVKSPEIELLVVGGRAPEVSGLRVTSEPWSEEVERNFLRQVDIGLMPLPNNAWTRGKCAYKALQYMAAGIPVVADDVGISARVIGHERGGLIARQLDDWVQHMATLAENPRLRARLGRTGRQRIEEGYSVERWAPELAALIRGQPVAAAQEHALGDSSARGA